MIDCAHIFVIPQPDGRELLPGRCRRCGLVREFKATVKVAFGNVFAVKDAGGWLSPTWPW